MTSYFVAYVLTNLVAGVSSDKFGSRKLLIFSTVFTALFSFLTGFIVNFFQGLILMLLTGFAAGFTFAPALKVISSWFSAEERGFAIGVYVTGGVIGEFMALTFVPMIVAVMGIWRWSFYIPASTTFVIGILIFLLLSEKSTNITSVAYSYKESSSPKSHHELLASKDLLLISFTEFCSMGVRVAEITWIPTFLSETIKTPLPLTEILLSLLILTSAMGNPFVGALSDRIGRKLCSCCMLLVRSALLFITPYIGSDASTLCILFFSLGFFASATIPLMSLLTTRFHHKYVGTVMGLYNAVGFAGAMLFPALFGFLIDLTRSITYGFMMFSGVLIIGVFSLSLTERG